jgi:hypothetical protein
MKMSNFYGVDFDPSAGFSEKIDCDTAPALPVIDACFQSMVIYTTQVMIDVYVTRIQYTLSNGEMGSVGE